LVEGEIHMSIFVMREGQIQSDKIADMKSYLIQTVPETRSYDGCQGIDVYFNIENPGNMVVLQQWESRDHFDRYLQWREETGVVARSVSMLTEPIGTRYFKRADV
jgi:quinol monooxygenase YgiN